MFSFVGEGFSGGSDAKETACNERDLGLMPEFGRSLEKGMLPTPVFLPEEFHGQRSLEGFSPWSAKETNRTEQLTLSLSFLS